MTKFRRYRDLNRRSGRASCHRDHFSERMTGSVRCRRSRAGRSTPSSRSISTKSQNLAEFLRQPVHPAEVHRNAEVRSRTERGGLSRRPALSDSVELLVRGGEQQLLGRTVGGHSGVLAFAGKPTFGQDCLFFGKTFSRTSLKKLSMIEAASRCSSRRAATGRFASNVGEIRHMHYQMALNSDIDDGAGTMLPRGTTLRGRKTLQYVYGENPWRQLVELDLTGTPPDAPAFRTRAAQRRPVATFLRGFASPLQIAQQRDLPAAWMDPASAGLFLARIILKIHFWSFRLPKVPEIRSDARRATSAGGAGAAAHAAACRAPRETPDDAEVFLLLTRYRRDTNEPGKPVAADSRAGIGRHPIRDADASSRISCSILRPGLRGLGRRTAHEHRAAVVGPSMDARRGGARRRPAHRRLRLEAHR